MCACVAGSVGQPLAARPPFAAATIGGRGRREPLERATGAVRVDICAGGSFEPFRRKTGRVVVVTEIARERIHQHQRRYPLRMRGGEIHRKEPAGRRPEHRGAFHSRRVHHHTQIVGPVLDARRPPVSIRSAPPAGIEDHQTTERRKTVEELTRRRIVPEQIDWILSAARHQQIDRTLTHDLERKVDITVACVARLGHSIHHQSLAVLDARCHPRRPSPARHVRVRARDGRTTTCQRRLVSRESQPSAVFPRVPVGTCMACRSGSITPVVGHVGRPIGVRERRWLSG
jgi:hypothetical protein